MLFRSWGNIFHDWVTTILEEGCLSGNLKKVEKEIPFKITLPNLKFPVSGRIDAIVNGMIGLEIKSSFSRFFFGTNGLIASGPKPEYLMQALCYLKAKPELEYFIMLFLARDIGWKMQYRIERKGDAIVVKHFDFKERKDKVREYPEINFGQIVSRWMALEKFLESNQEPPMDFKFKSKYPCNFCVYLTKCYPDKKVANVLPQFDFGQKEG